MVRRFNDLNVAYQLVGILLQLSVDTQVRTLGLGGTKRRGLSPLSVTRVRFLEGGGTCTFLLALAKGDASFLLN